MLEPKKSGNNALQRPMKPSAELAAITGSGNIARSDVVSKMWDYIKKNNLQNPQNKREIMADAKLKPIFGGRSVEHTSELQSLMRISYAVFCLKKKTHKHQINETQQQSDIYNTT